MNFYRSLQGLLVACLFVVCAWSGAAKAQSPYYDTGYWGGYPYGWGYFGYSTWPVGYWQYPYNYGYDYYVRVPTYGVLVWSQTQEVGGFAWGQSSIDAATYVAQSNCTGVADCQPVVWVSNGCAAIATSPTNKRLGWAYANTKYNAISAAQRACVSSGGIGCTNRGFVCSF